MAVNAKNWQELKKPNMLEKKLSAGDTKLLSVQSAHHAQERN